MAPDAQHARDPDLLDALDAQTRVPYNGTVWRVVRNGRDPLEPSNVAGRWDLGNGHVLYTALDADGAIAEMEFHLSLQPVFPSKYQATLYEIRVDANRSLRFETLDSLVPFGVEAERYRELLYDRTQQLGDAAAFLAAEVLIVPSARWPCLNAVLIVQHLPPERVAVVSQAPVDWHKWRSQKRPRQR